MNTSSRILEIMKLFRDKTNQLTVTDKEINPALYNQLQDEIAVLNNELHDLLQIDIADSSKAIEKKDKNIQFLLDQMDFENMESTDLRVLGKIHDTFSRTDDDTEAAIKDMLSFEKPENKINSEDKKEQ